MNKYVSFAAPHHLYLAGGVEFESAKVKLPHITGRAKTTSGAGTFLRFEGVKHPKGFRGEHIGYTWEYTSVYALVERELLNALDELFTTQFGAADASIVLRRPVSPTQFTDDVVEVHEWTETSQAGGVSQMNFRATRVG